MNLFSYLSKITNLLSITPVTEDEVKSRVEVIQHTTGDTQRQVGKFYQSQLKESMRKGIWLPKPGLLPDVSHVKVILGQLDPLAMSGGLLKRYPSSLELITNRNRRANRYLLRQQYRLLQLQNQPEAYWKLSLYLINMSNVYLIYCLWSIAKNSYRTLSHNRLLRTLKEVNRLRAKGKLTILPSVKTSSYHKSPVHLMSHYLKLVRVFIPKNLATGYSTTSWRPLGVPSLATRIYLRMWLLPILGSVQIAPNQHGFVPNRGTKTAWQELLRTTLHQGNIWEFDLKGFFPSVSPDLLDEVLENRWHYPEAVREYLKQMNNSTAMLPKQLFKNPEMRRIQSSLHRVLVGLGLQDRSITPHPLEAPEKM